jgi:hypothetical protein
VSVRRHLLNLILCGGVAGAFLYFAPASATGQPSTEPNDAVARLNQRLASGQATLEYRPPLGYLPSLLQQLDINPDSQVLVFSKTSFQQSLISPKNPRAIYFNDDVALGDVPGGQVFELSALDPDRGVIFYTLNMQQSDHPRFESRTDVCDSCHGPVSVQVPGLMVTSVIPNADGVPFFTGAFFNITDHRTPIGQRWGGWYVTGTSEPHQGNSVASDPNRPTELDTKDSQNLTSLSGRFNLSNYPVPTSDIVALMTLEHQTRMINLITSVSAQANSLAEKGKLDTVSERLDQVVDEIVASMLFADEAPLNQPVKGVSKFTETFPRQGPRDRQGRSLRDFDLQKRMFRYPLSYMIYSPIFDHMQSAVRERIYRRLYEVLSGKDSSAKYARLSAQDRTAILQILRETKPNLPDFFK